MMFLREVTVTNSVVINFYQLLSVKLTLITNFVVKKNIFFIFSISADKIRSEKDQKCWPTISCKNILQRVRKSETVIIILKITRTIMIIILIIIIKTKNFDTCFCVEFGRYYQKLLF